MSAGIAIEGAAPEPGENAIPKAGSQVPRAPHVIAYRVSLPIFGRRYYVGFFFGHEQRRIERLVADNQKKSWWHTSFSLSAAFLSTSTFVMCGLAMLYLAKSLLGIDLTDDHFFLHGLFFD